MTMLLDTVLLFLIALNVLQAITLRRRTKHVIKLQKEMEKGYAAFRTAAEFLNKKTAELDVVLPPEEEDHPSVH